MDKPLRHLLVPLAAVLLLLPIGVPAEEANTAKVELVWPAPPQPARIRHLLAVATPEDIGREKGFFRRLWEFIRGPENEEMRKPMAVVADASGRFYVADPAAKCLHVFDQSEGKYQRWESVGRDTFGFPLGLALDAQDRVYVADSEHRRIHVLDPEGELLRSYGGAELQRPTGIAVDTERERLYVVDTPSHEVKVYGLAGGELLDTIGAQGTQPGDFNYPSFVAVDAAGKLYVTDGLNGRVQVLSPDGEPLRTVGRHGDGSGDFSAPKGVAVDSEGHLYVADAAFDNIQVFDAEGQLLLYFGTAGSEAGRFWMPSGLYVDDQDRIYVADSYNKRVQVFQYVKQGEGR